MLEIIDKEHFREAYNLAKELGKKDPRIKKSFYLGIRTINKLKRNLKADYVCIQPDSVPYSFNWGLLRNDKLLYNGGMEMYGGNWRNGSITLEPVKYPQWRINT